MTQYIVIINVPGYLPEDDDPYITDDYASAVQYMNEEVERSAEIISEGEGIPRIEWGWASANNYAAAMLYDDSREHDLGISFAIELCEEDDSDS